MGQLATASPFAEAGDAPPHLVLSALFRNDPAYRRFYRIWQDMNLGIAAVFGDFLSLPLARTFELYELWCFLRLVRAGVEEFGAGGIDIRDLFFTSASGGVTLTGGAVTVPVGSGWKLCFQKTYREFWNEPDGQGSYSRIMTPDLVAVREPAAEGQTGRLIVLDAKYRIDEGLNDALSSIHTYRDALVREVVSGQTEGVVTAAYLLTPHVPVLGADCCVSAWGLNVVGMGVPSSQFNEINGLKGSHDADEGSFFDQHSQVIGIVAKRFRTRRSGMKLAKRHEAKSCAFLLMWGSLTAK